MDFKDLIEKRTSIKKFDLNKKPDWRKILRAIDAARFIARAGKHFNLKYLIVSDKDIIEQIADAAQQDFISHAHYVVICVSDETQLTQLYGERGKRYGAQQAGASIQNFLLALTEEKLATTWVGHYYDEMIKSLTDIPAHAIIEALFPIGITGKTSHEKPSKKTDLENMIFFNKWGNQYMTPDSKVSNP
ncbi:MAG: nitroreductase [Patescibacteria group bacterium]|jgi:nitroreductase